MKTEGNHKQNVIRDELTAELRRDLEAALVLVREYEAIITQLRTEQKDILKNFTHDMANPLQILSMTIESLEDRAPKDLAPSLERMKRSADHMVSIITTLRKFREESPRPFPTKSL